MARKTSSSEDASILVVSLDAFAPDQRTGIEARVRKEITQETRAQRAGVVFHHLDGVSLYRPSQPAVQAASAGVLAELLASLLNLKLVVTFGVAAHLSTIHAYGMGWTRVPFRPGKMTALPDGLVLANFPAAHGEHIDTIALLLAQIPPSFGAAPQV